MNCTVLIDGSYYVFYRFHALRVWWSKARKEDEPELPEDAPRFIETFKRTFYKKLFAILKKRKINTSRIWVAKDCPRKNIWRTQTHMTDYKAGRKPAPSGIGYFMKLAYSELFVQPTIRGILQHPHLEADDCVALSCNEMTKLIDITQENDNVSTEPSVCVVTSDMDYLQLADSNVMLLTLKNTLLTDSKQCIGNKKDNLMFKIIIGDVADNIPGIFERCGKKTAVKLMQDPSLLSDKLANTPGATERFNKNKTLIDFTCIPDAYKNEFLSQPETQELISLFSVD